MESTNIIAPQTEENKPVISTLKGLEIGQSELFSKKQYSSVVQTISRLKFMSELRFSYLRKDDGLLVTRTF
jgi:hypothetical protein